MSRSLLATGLQALVENLSPGVVALAKTVTVVAMPEQLAATAEWVTRIARAHSYKLLVAGWQSHRGLHAREHAKWVVHPDDLHALAEQIPDEPAILLGEPFVYAATSGLHIAVAKLAEPLLHSANLRRTLLNRPTLYLSDHENDLRVAIAAFFRFSQAKP